MSLMLETLALWPVSRLDIAVKVLYAQHYLGLINDPPGISIREIYRRHIELRTGGIEPGSSTKTSVENYEHAFIELIDDINSLGFLVHEAIPVNQEKLLLNGAHRLAAAIALNIESIPVTIAERSFYRWDMRWFIQHDFCAEELNLMIRCWVIKKAENAGALILQPESYDQWHILTQTIASRTPLLAWRDLWLPEKAINNTQKNGTVRILWIEANHALREKLCVEFLKNTGHALISSGNQAETLKVARLLLTEENIDQLQNLPAPSRPISSSWINKNNSPANFPRNAQHASATL